MILESDEEFKENWNISDHRMLVVDIEETIWEKMITRIQKEEYYAARWKECYNLSESWAIISNTAGDEH